MIFVSPSQPNTTPSLLALDQVLPPANIRRTFQLWFKDNIDVILISFVAQVPQGGEGPKYYMT